MWEFILLCNVSFVLFLVNFVTEKIEVVNYDSGDQPMTNITNKSQQLQCSAVKKIN